MSKTKTIVSGVSWSIIQNIASILYGIVSVPFLISYFGKSEYGLIGLAMSVNVYIQLMDMGMSSTNVKFFSEFLVKGDSDKTQRLFSTMHFLYLIIGVVNSIVLFVLSFFVSYLFKVSPEQAIILKNLLIILGLNAVFSWISACYDQFLQANDLLDWTRKRMTLLKVLQFVVLLCTITFGLSIEIYFFLYVFMVTLILPLSIRKVSIIAPDMKRNFSFNNTIFKLVFPFAISIFSFSIFQFLTLNFRPLILGNMAGPDSVAEYNVMNSIALVVTVFSSSFIQVLIPIVTKARVTSDQVTISIVMKEGTKYVTILLASVIFLLVLSVKEIVILYVGDGFVNLSRWIVVWLLTLLLSHRNAMTSMVFTENNLKSVVVMSFVAMIFAMTCYFMLVPKLGVGGVVVGFAIHELIHTLFYYIYFLPRKFSINTGVIFVKSVLPVIFILGVITFTVSIIFKNIHVNVFADLIFKSMSAVVLYVFSIWYILLDKTDKARVRSFILNHNTNKPV